MADADRFFAVLDVDGSGLLEGPEVDRYEREILPEMSRLHASRRRPGGGAGAEPQRRRRDAPELPRGAGLFGLIDSPHPVKAADQDMDSRVTRAEYRAILLRRFDVLDKAGAGALVLAALPPTPIQILSGQTLSGQPLSGVDPEPRKAFPALLS
jgi:hypothetical protein